MDANVSDATEATVRAELRAWLEANWDPNLSLADWRSKLVDSGWGAPAWPRAWHGRDLPPALEAVVAEEMRRAGAVGVARSGVRGLAAATLLEHGGEFHKRKFLRRILTGEDNWCQLFSEPGSGSDLAGALTRAELKDGRWIINGQKVWTTSAHHATGASCWRAPTQTCPSTRASPTSCSTCISPASRSGRSGK